MGVFRTTNGSVDASQLEQEGIQLLEAAFEDWTPAKGDPLTWVNKAFSRIGAQVYGQAATLEQGAFKGFGEEIVRIPPIQASPATAASTWTMVDNAGYPIPAGTVVDIAVDASSSEPFETTELITVAPGATKATVPLRAVNPGTGANELTANPTLSTALSFVVEPNGITLNAPTAGGVDEEEEETYLGRLVETIRLLSISLILPEDFETDARAIADVFRCKCIRGYNPVDKTTENALHFCDLPIDAKGEPITAEAKKELAARQEAKLLGGVIMHIADPEYTPVDGETGIVVAAGFDKATVIAAAEARLAEYFSPANWGLPTNGEGSGWINRTSVYYNEVISEIDRVGGVDRVASLKIAKHEKALGTADIELSGVAPLTKLGTFKVTAV